MNETPQEIRKRIREELMKLSGSERVQMASRSFDAARAMVIASLPKDLPPAEFKLCLYQRIYGEAPEWLKKLILGS